MTGAEYKIAATLAEGIIPATDTPGAIGAGVPDFLRKIFNDWFLKEEQLAFRAALQGYDAAAVERFGKPLVECGADQQQQLVVEWNRQATARGPSGAPPSPFRDFKRLVLHGYYTSQVGQDEELKTTMDAALDHPEGPLFGALG